MTPDYCPVCGAAVPERARACPECGADEQTGWSDEAKYDSLGIPDDSFDYNDFIKKEFEAAEPKRKHQWLWMIAAVLLLIAFTWMWFR